ncbi:CoA-binding protein [Planktothrix sp. FACHB-1365]|uniref:CoA-binding protein n=1 Tax=Planktothrix sp. FACHB-1365 TaxID=2692855 RepID=UPI00168958C3|nr:CoA-binding protein [Planktothrix sp. FACHB-1365]MBD2480469.1 CoA-binding protein [Planktothrix sp. FACHB-1365]
MSINLNQDDTAMREVLTHGRVIALVGYSNKPERASYQVGQFLRNVGYRVYPVNPAFTEIDNQPCYPNLTAIPEPIDIVNVFRRSEFLTEIVEEAIAVQAKTVWAQTGIFEAQAAEIALKAGLNIAMNCCIKIEYYRLNIPIHP